jgi:hypothetical protein
MGWRSKVAVAVVSVLWGGAVWAQAKEAHLVYTSDLRGTVGICG